MKPMKPHDSSANIAVSMVLVVTALATRTVAPLLILAGWIVGELVLYAWTKQKS